MSNDNLDDRINKKEKLENSIKTIHIDNLQYETLNKIFDLQLLYETDYIIVEQKQFTTKEIEDALSKHCNDLTNIYSVGNNVNIDGNEIILDNRTKIIQLLIDMLDDDYSDDLATAIEETLLNEIFFIHGFRETMYYMPNIISDGIEINKRYFNNRLHIETHYLNKLN